MSLCAAAVPSPQMLLPQQSSTDGWSSHRPLLVIRFRYSPVAALRVAQELQAELDEMAHGRRGIGLPAGDDEDPRHVVGAVAVLAASAR